MKSVFSNSKFIYTTFAITGFTYTAATLQYFFTDYLFSRNKPETMSAKTIFITYISTLFFAPLIGTLLSRFSTPKKTG